MLEDALTVCNNTATQNLIEIAKANKIVQKTPSNAPLYTSILQGYVVEQIPIFNIFEAICWIYTCCVEADEIVTDREAECYLYQLLVIFREPGTMGGWVMMSPVPSRLHEIDQMMLR